jgi:hypothetical protein
MGTLRIIEMQPNWGADGRGPVGCGADVLLIIGWIAGPVACGASAGALVALLLGSTLARAFHVLFGIALGWIAPMLAIMAYYAARLGGRDVTPPEILEASSGLTWVAGLLTAIVIAKNTTGFSGRSRVRGWLGLAIGAALGAAGTVYATNMMNSITPWRMEDGILVAIGAAFGAGVGGTIGAIFGANREEAQGFAVLTNDDQLGFSPSLHETLMPSPGDPS